MKNRTRIITWIICLIVSIGILVFKQYQENKPNTPKKEKIQLYNDAVKEEVIMKIFNESELNAKYKLNLDSELEEADCIITNDRTKIDTKKANLILNSYTPLIIVMKNSENLKTYEKNGLLSFKKGVNKSVNDEISIDFKKIINEIIEEDPEKNESDFRIIVPKKDTTEGKIFYNFLIVTINGTYPNNEEDLDKIKEKANEFLESPNCIEKEDVVSELDFINSIDSKDLYILFEADFMNSNTWKQKSLDLCIAYPNVTVVKHIYMQMSEKCEQICQDIFEASTLNYRNSKEHTFLAEKNYNVKEDIKFVEVFEEEKGSSDIVETIFFIIIVIILIITGIVLIFGE